MNSKSPLLECIPNLSEGRNHKALDQLWQDLQGIHDLYCLHQHRDEDHHRSVLTLAGTPLALTQAVHHLYDWSSQHIDLRQHNGAHPRMGAVDVCPFVVLDGMTQTEAVAFSHDLGGQIVDRWQIPVVFYEHSAYEGKEHRLPMLRKQWRENTDLTALGATVLGVRGPLIAWNVWLASDDLKLAQCIASNLREVNGGFPALRALGLYLPRANQVQVSMNLIDPKQSSLFEIYAAIADQAANAGVQVSHTEFIGLVPESAFFNAAAHFFKSPLNLATEHGLNTHLRVMKNRDFRDFFS